MNYTEDPYTKYVWSETTPITAKRLDESEGQWDCIKSEVDSHDHDDEHYPSTESDITFFSTSYYTGFDADTLDSQHISQLFGTAFPAGSIVIWPGAENDIPTGWYICDGSTHNGYVLPDLRDRYVIGAEGLYSSHTIGGATTFRPTGIVTVASHILTTSELPEHTHTYTEQDVKLLMNDSSIYHDYALISRTSTSRTAQEQTVGDGGHGHPGSTVLFAELSTIPASKAFFFIGKCF